MSLNNTNQTKPNLADPTSPMPFHCAVIILFKSVPVYQLSLLALLRVTVVLAFVLAFRMALLRLRVIKQR